MPLTKLSLCGILQDGFRGTPLAGQPIYLSISYQGQHVYLKTTTDINGGYKFTRSESAPGSYGYSILFRGNSSFDIARAMITVNVGTLIPSKFSLNISDRNPDVNQPFTISGYLTDINGAKLPNRRLSVTVRLPTGQWDTMEIPSTNSSGYYSVTITEQTSGQYRYELRFAGDGTYAYTVSGVEVAIGTLKPTKLSISSTDTNPGVGQYFILYGYLKDTSGKPISGAEIFLYRYAAGQYQSNIFQKRYTNQNGYYSIVLNEKTSGNIIRTAEFFGDQTHAFSHDAVSLKVGKPTTTTITASDTTPAVNQKVTFTVTLLGMDWRQFGFDSQMRLSERQQGALI